MNIVKLQVDRFTGQYSPDVNSLNEQVATYVRAQAGAKGYSSQNALARAAGLPVSSVRRYFWTGESPIALDAVAHIADLFGISLSEMLRRAEQIEPEPFIKPRPRSAHADDDAAGAALDRTPGQGRGKASDVRAQSADRE